MLEFSLMTGLLQNIIRLSKQEKATKVVAITIWLGALSNISAEHVRKHFLAAAKDSMVKDAVLEIEESNDVFDVDAQNILIKAIEVVQDLE